MQMATWHPNRWRAAGGSPDGYSRIAVIATVITPLESVDGIGWCCA